MHEILEPAALPLFGQKSSVHYGVNCLQRKQMRFGQKRKRTQKSKAREPYVPSFTWNKLWTGYYNEECLSIKYDGQGNIQPRFIPRAEK